MNYMGHTTDLKFVENHKPNHNESCMYIIDNVINNQISLMNEITCNCMTPEMNKAKNIKNQLSGKHFID